MGQRQFYKELHLDLVDKKIDSQGAIPIQDYCAALYRFICKQKQKYEDDGYWQWLTELHAMNHGAHRLTIFNLKDGDICDLLHKKNFRKDPIYIIMDVKFNRNTPLLTYEDAFDSEMNDKLTLYRQGNKKLKNKNPVAYPWIFNHILYEMAEAIRTYRGGDSMLLERFKLVP